MLHMQRECFVKTHSISCMCKDLFRIICTSDYVPMQRYYVETTLKLWSFLVSVTVNPGLTSKFSVENYWHILHT